MKERLKLNEREVEAFVNKLRNLMTKIEDVPVPVLTALDGVALGGGQEMAIATDIRVASDTAKVFCCIR